MRYDRDIPFPVKQYANNAVGRDFVVADLHGCLDLFEKKLDRAGFDPERDVVYSVGDLCDRGARSFDTLCLIEKPWFRFVPGNHEAMLLTYLNVRGSDYHRASDFLYNGGYWIDELTEPQRRHLRDVLVPILFEAPLVMQVADEDCPFNVLHAEAMDKREKMLCDADFRDMTLIEKQATPLAWSRRLVGKSQRLLNEHTVVAANGTMIAEPALHPGLSLTYVGHTILEQPILHKSHLFIDGGAYMAEAGNEAAGLSLLNHRDTVRMLRAAGVAL